MENPWRDGKYKSGDGGHDLITINGDTVTFVSFNKAKLKYGSFGPADARIVEMTGQSDYNVELSYNFVNKEMSDYGVILEDGTKLVLKGISGILTRIWISDEEAELIENDGDPIEAPTSPYKIEPERQGRFVFIFGGVLYIPEGDFYICPSPLSRTKMKKANESTRAAVSCNSSSKRWSLWWLIALFHFGTEEVRADGGDYHSVFVFSLF